MSGNQFGGPAYTSPETRELSSITESPNPDAADFASADKMAALLQRHDFQIKALAQGQQQLQQGVNDATNNPIQQIQQFIADVIVLLGGGEITEGVLDFGDLQYILPTLGALFGLGDAPFPVDLFQAAERFFFGYVVPNQQFTDEINTIIKNWLSLIGIDPQFIKDLQDLTTAIGTLFGSVGNLLPSLTQLFEALGIDANDLGPLGQLLGPIIKFFSGLDLKKIGTLLEFVTDALDPIVKDLTAVINFINAVLAVLGFEEHGGGGVVNSPLPELTVPFENLMAFLGDINLGSGDFDPIEAAYDFIDRVLAPTGLLPTAQQIAAAISGLTGQDINLDDVSTFFTNLRAFLTGIDFNVADFDPLAAAEQFINNVLNPTGLLMSITSPISSENLFGPISGALLPNIPAAHISGAEQNLLTNPEYVGENSVDGESSWTWTGTLSRVAGGGAVQATGDGSTKQLLSDPAIEVDPGQTLKPAHYLQWDGITASGAAFLLGVNYYSDAAGTTLLSSATVATIANPAANSGGWQQMAGADVVPDGAATARLWIEQTDAVTAGISSWTSAWLSKTGTIPTKLLSLAPLLAGFLTDGSSIIGQLISAWPNVTAGLDGLDGLGAIFSDVAGLMGHPGGLGSGAPVLPGFSDIPLLNPMFTGGLFKPSLIPTLDASKIGTGQLSAGVLPVITAGMTQGLADIDAIVNALGITGAGNTRDTLQAALKAIPNENVSGLLGPDNIGAALQATADKLYQGFSGLLDAAGISLENLQSSAQNMRDNTTSAVTISQDTSAKLAKRAVTKPGYHANDPTVDVTVPFTSIPTASANTPQTIPVTASASAIGCLSTPDGGVKKAITWWGGALTNITGIYLTVYSINLTTGQEDPIWQSGNILSGVTANVQNYYNLPAANYITTGQGYWYAVEIAITGSGTYNVAGLVHWAQANTNYYPHTLGQTRNTSGGVAASSIAVPVSSNNIPFFGLAGSEGASAIAPVTQEFLASGTYNVPSWAQVAGTKFDIIVLGAGGSAQAGASGLGVYGSGAGGWGGHFYGVTLTYGVDIPLGTTQFTVAIGAGGAYVGTPQGNGQPGGATTVTVPGYGAISGPGGAATTTSSYWSNTPSGQGAVGNNGNTFMFNGIPYLGGASQTARSSTGISPGGAGSSGFDSPGGAGAGGAAWIRAYQG
ncbi:hypothetical protein GBP92_05905 [Mycobacterium avium subsp. hominissuis]|uniref:Glycine-rich domain-containing protein n=2 Tax=Mycobacterium timonense TaxID=701043 RepID=A0ABX3TSI6_9MYCO|nr:hypothetical protein [Mycobacterium avium]ETB34663.1 hypothetical protein N602_28240 [Mycobacterium avium subsp. hominissuis 10-5606]ORB81783.1 hypothetical protein BST46_01945 [Mycobacterium timonense]MBZ4500194.1 hypothetical protein [Mycobacterium avium subsp. hominissuis]MBZ4547741.1 hypothetical protein [Mycobacterium avium subsp. hominissuis]MBZ4600374.1 hypothetical protein [Mycobacterium avium subsp. hominissuis]